MKQENTFIHCLKENNKGAICYNGGFFRDRSHTSLRASGQEIVILDVRGNKEFSENHIEGAINIPLDQLENDFGKFGERRLVITVCGKGGGRSTQAAELLAAKGVKARWLFGGTFGWN